MMHARVNWIKQGLSTLNLFLFLGGFSSLLLITGCRFHSEELLPVRYARPSQRKISWKTREKKLRQFQKFTLQGHLEAHSHNHKGANLSFQWRQWPNSYQLLLFDESTHTHFEILQTPKGATLRFKGQVFSAQTADVLLRRHLSLQLPLTCFPRWLRGLPAVNVRKERVLTEAGHLLKLYQAGWFVRYLRYHQIRYLDLPTQLFMIKGEWSVRVLITHWTV